MNKELKERLKNDLSSSINEALKQPADAANPAGGTVLDAFIQSYTEATDNNEDAKGLTLGLNCRLVPKSDQIAIAVTAKWSSVTKFGLERGTALDVDMPLFNNPDGEEGGNEEEV